MFISNTWILARKELGVYFGSPVAYLVLTVFLVGSAANMIFIQGFFDVGQASMRTYFEWIPVLFLILVPPLTMRTWSEERREGTIELLMTLPIRPTEALLGKFIAAWLFLMLAMLLTLPIPITIDILDAPGVEMDWGPVRGGYLGSVLLGGAYLAIGMFVSSLSRSQILSIILSYVVLAVFLVIGSDVVLTGAGDFLAMVGNTFGFIPHFNNISRGILDSRDIVYFGSAVFFFLVMNRYMIGSYRYA